LVLPQITAAKKINQVVNARSAKIAEAESLKLAPATGQREKRRPWCRILTEEE
jgi:hypothetical protein